MLLLKEKSSPQINYYGITILFIYKFWNNRLENYILETVIQEYVKCFKQLEFCS